MVIKFKFPEFIFGMLFAVAVFSMGVVLAPNLSRPTDESTNTSTSNNQNNKENNYTFYGWLFHDAAGLFTCGLFAVGVAQAFLFFMQLRSINKSVEDTRTTAQAALDANRPWLTIDATPLMPMSMDDDDILVGFCISINNVGNSPAVKSRIK